MGIGGLRVHGTIASFLPSIPFHLPPSPSPSPSTPSSIRPNIPSSLSTLSVLFWVFCDTIPPIKTTSVVQLSSVSATVSFSSSSVRLFFHHPLSHLIHFFPPHTQTLLILFPSLPTHLPTLHQDCLPLPSPLLSSITPLSSPSPPSSPHLLL